MNRKTIYRTLLRNNVHLSSQRSIIFSVTFVLLILSSTVISRLPQIIGVYMATKYNIIKGKIIHEISRVHLYIYNIINFIN